MTIDTPEGTERLVEAEEDCIRSNNYTKDQIKLCLSLMMKLDIIYDS